MKQEEQKCDRCAADHLNRKVERSLEKALAVHQLQPANRGLC